MLVKKAFRFELMPKGGHIRRMKQSCGCARFVFNRALAYQKDLYESDKTSRFSYTRLADFLPAWKKEFPWLKDCHSQMLQQSLKDLGSAYRNFFSKRTGFPRFKRKGVRAKSGLNRSILDQGWYEFRRQLEYKLAWKGGILVVVTPQNTSRRCPECGYVSAENRQTQAEFRCVACGFEENADLVAAINILRAGLARIACEVNGAVMPSAVGTHRGDQGTCALAR